MVDYNKLLEEAIYKSPLALLSIKDANSISKIREYLPFSTGFEIECHYKGFEVKNFEEIPKIMAVDCASYEQRYRIPYGINGLICLYLICEQLKVNSALNPGSGIHYHVDMTELAKKVTSKLLCNNEEWILKELDLWEFKGNGQRQVRTTKGGWLGLRKERDTMEFRCGEMSFDYSHLVYRIISANSIIKRLKEQIEIGFTNRYIQANPDTIPDNKEIITYIKTHSGSITSRKMSKLEHEANRINLELQKLSATSSITIGGPNIKEVVKSRTQKMI